MIGFKVPRSNICVDYWEDEEEPQVRFLTHVHDNRLQNISKVKDRIYMSSFSRWYLREIHKENIQGSITCLTLNKRHKIRASNETGKDAKFFHVTLIDAEHCPGSVMYFFEGDFGQVLCTGDFRLTSNMFSNPTLNSLVKSKSLDVLNFDNRYIGEHCNFPSREETLKSIVEMLKSFPEHKIVVCIGKWGKFDLLQAIAKEFDEKVSVSSNFMMIARKLGISNSFTTQHSRIITHETDMLSLKELDTFKSRMGPTIILVMSALYSTCVRYGKRNQNEYRKLGLHLIPYSDHSNHQELYEFIDALRPNFIVPIVKSSLSERHNKDLVRNYTIPECIAHLQRSYGLGRHQDSTIDQNSEPLVCDILDKMHSKRANPDEVEKPSTEQTKERFPPSENVSQNDSLKAKKIKVGTPDKENGHNNQEYDSCSKEILNYWTNQGITGQIFRHPDLQGIYEDD